MAFSHSCEICGGEHSGPPHKLKVVEEVLDTDSAMSGGGEES